MEFAPFYIGQRVIAIEDHTEMLFKKGDEFTVTNLGGKLCKCNNYYIQIGNIQGYGNGTCCRLCDTKISYSGALWFKSSRFAPIDELKQVTYTEILEEVPMSSN